MSPAATTQYQFATLTSSPPAEVLDGIAGIDLPADLSVTERGSTYLVIGPKPSAYDARLAVALCTLLVLTVLILSAFSVVLIAFLPVAAVPLIPLLLRDSDDLAVGAVPDDRDGATRVTIHGQAPAKLTSALDLFLTHLPVPPELSDEPPAANGSNGHSGPRSAGDQPVRAPEPTAAD
ncbi:MAG TPA: hypothetical protein VN193_00240 [Candidatus Angelobacter sp.]|jgi:hypothetical protein|nr:hypothetical protein [Candidatus Angelobacter sp.]